MSSGSDADRLFEISVDLLCLSGVDGYFRRVNPAFERTLGFTAKELLAAPFYEFLHPDDLARSGEEVARIAGGQPCIAFENRYRCKDGSYRWLSWRSSVPDAKGICYAIARDITEERVAELAFRKAEASLRETEQQFWSAFETSGVGMAISVSEGRFVRVNRVFCEMLGYTSDEMLQRTAGDITYPGDRVALSDITRWAGPQVLEKRYLHKSGRVVWANVSVATLQAVPGKPVQQIGIVQDITERKQAEEAVRRSEAEMRALVRALPDTIVIFGRDGTYLKIAESAAKLVYQPSVERLGRRVHEVLPESLANLIVRHIHRALDTRSPVKVSYQVDIGEQTVWYEGTVSPMLDDTVLWVARDVSEQRRFQDDLQASEQRHRLLFQRNPFPMWLFDAQTMEILDVNEAAITIYGYSAEEFRSMSISDILAGPEAPQIIALRATPGAGRNQVGSHHHRRKDGTLMTVEVVSEDADIGGRPARLVLVRDITEQETLEAQLRQAQKMEAIGQLAGGVAHDFNNLLTAIRGYSDMVVESFAPDDNRREDMGEIIKAADRAGALTRQLLAFSRKQILQPTVVDLNAVVSGVHSMLGRLVGEDVQIVTRAKSNLGRLKADVGQLEQVLVNLVVNARDAMPKGGTLTIETAEVELDADYGIRHGTAVPGGVYVMLAVTDTGTGMDKETRSHMFEPFFTTKETGKGTGLGLSTVYGIVKQSGGFVWVYSEPGQGTTFKIYFPKLSDGTQEPVPVQEVVPERIAHETLLLVEDEDTVRGLATKILQKQGYRVLSARHGREAVTAVTEFAGIIHLVITDVVMPEMGGRELASELSILRPGVPILYISGYTDDEIIRRGVLNPAMAFIEKPFTSTTLLRKVRQILDEHAERQTSAVAAL